MIVYHLISLLLVALKLQSLTQLFRKDSLLKSLLQTNYFFFYFTSLSLSNLSKNFTLNFFLQITASDFSSSLLTTTRLLRRVSIIFLVIYKNNFQRAFRFAAADAVYLKKTSSLYKASALQLTAKLVSITNSKKEVFQPHLPVRLPCYDLAPVTSFALGRSSRSRTSGAPGFHGLTGGVYKARERIHRAMADARLLANPTSWSRVADSNPNWDGFSRSASCRQVASLCTHHCNTCVAPDVRAVLI